MNWKAKIALGMAIALMASTAVTAVAFLTTQTEEVASTEAGLYVSGARVEDPGVMMTVGDNEIGFDEYRYYYMMNKMYTEQNYGTELWDQDYDGAMGLQLRQMTEDNIVQAYVLQKVAAEAGIALSDIEKQEIADTMAKQKETLGEAGFAKNLREMFFTSEEMYLRITEMQRLLQKTQEELKANYITEVETDLGKYFATAKHILITPDGFGSQPATAEEELLDAVGEEVASNASSDAAASAANSEVPADSAANSEVPADIAANSEVPADSAANSEVVPDLTDEEKDAAAKSFSEELLAQLRFAEAQGQDINVVFDQLSQEFNMDPGSAQSPGGYTFGDGRMVAAFYEATMALEPGQISELVPSEFGYHIIMRLPLDEEALGDGDKAAAIDQEASMIVNKMTEAAKESIEVSYGAYYQEVTPKNMH